MTTAKSGVKVRYYRFRNHLKNKASLGGGGDSGPGKISAAALAAAENEFDKMAEDYPDWVQGHLSQLYEFHKACLEDEGKRKAQFKLLNQIAHDMKGQGGTFGFPLISHFAESLYQFTVPSDEEVPPPIKDNDIEIVKAHIDSMKAVISGRVSGDGGAIGRELKKGFEKAIEKLQAAEG